MSLGINFLGPPLAMPLLFTDNVNVATHLTYDVPISVRDATNSTTVSAAIPAIAGGTAAGVVLAVVAAMGWKWWASIVKYMNKYQSSSNRRNVLKKRSRATPTKLNEAFVGTTMDCSSAESSDCKNDIKVSSITNTPSPHPAIHHNSSTPTAPASSGPPIKPPRNPARALRRPSKENAVRANMSSFAWASNRLPHKDSTVSTASVYSTQSAEQQQARVPAAVIVAALGHTFGTRRLSTLRHNSEPHTIGEEQIELVLSRQQLQPSTHSDDVRQLHRVSNISDGSLELQEGSQTIDPIGMAYGGEESEEPSESEGRFYKEWLGAEQHDIAPLGGRSTDLH